MRTIRWSGVSGQISLIGKGTLLVSGVDAAEGFEGFSGHFKGLLRK